METSKKKRFVHFGCGTCAPSSWSNFDAGPAFWLGYRFPFLKSHLVKRGFPAYPGNIEYGDVIKGLDVERESASAIYCSHVLEHLSLEDLRTTLRNVYMYLVPGGTFRFVLPDLEWLAKRYVQSSDSEAASRFMRETWLGTEALPKGISGLLRTVFGRSAHLWMWDYKNITEELKAAAFINIRRAQFHDNPEGHFREVEDAGRWENCLGIECKKAESP
jgi:hypothetical protein